MRKINIDKEKRRWDLVVDVMFNAIDRVDIYKDEKSQKKGWDTEKFVTTHILKMLSEKHKKILMIASKELKLKPLYLMYYLLEKSIEAIEEMKEEEETTKKDVKSKVSVKSKDTTRESSTLINRF